ncbi:glycosyltransferase [Primorskyibacter sp. S187A]|uniref:glycosyltransferase n=1 Tax=Primorskyibacter sp. S187A TaxID=3415130 RepID=UPI003C7A76A3
MKQPINSVSIVMPAYNAADIITTGLQSLLDQDFKPDHYEIILVDDCSTDETVAVIEAFIPVAKDAGVSLSLLRQSQNGGPAKARNTGARDATGDVIIFTDSDCELTPAWLGEMLKPFADPEIAAVKGAYLTRQREIGARFAQVEFEERYRMLETAETVDVVFSYSAAFRRPVFESLNGFDTRFPVADNEDTDLSWRLVEAGHKAAFAPHAKLYHRHPPSIWTYFRKKVSRGYWRIIVYRRFPEKAVKDSYTPQSLKIQILLVLLIAACLILGLVLPGLWWVAGLLALAFLATTLSFVAGAFKTDPLIALLSPLLLFGRAASIGWGVLKAIPRAMSRDPLAPVKPEEKAS